MLLDPGHPDGYPGSCYAIHTKLVGIDTGPEYLLYSPLPPTIHTLHHHALPKTEFPPPAPKGSPSSLQPRLNGATVGTGHNHSDSPSPPADRSMGSMIGALGLLPGFTTTEPVSDASDWRGDQTGEAQRRFKNRQDGWNLRDAWRGEQTRETQTLRHNWYTLPDLVNTNDVRNEAANATKETIEAEAQRGIQK
ncbi:uncharacterized protein N7458_005632 [Penicillium daleae]|uniref:Uncharacterized protein n=1 Tax=Penicillium daleae TaxID=63821 RepID=A0AAD6G3R0_9EURO|nr:uncharacterized protein N7458_005632 [Penicillium daleae]KAJ5454676.1 hypothetical protein N7458_005632 [Penicillium daleae]